MFNLYAAFFAVNYLSSNPAEIFSVLQNTLLSFTVSGVFKEG